MANENETVMAVCAEWRACIESADPSVWNSERIAGLVKTTKAQQLAYLARIEAAWRREKAEIEANALAVGGIVEAARHKPGNAAAMREALITIRQQLQTLDTYGGIVIEAYLTIVGWIDAALSAPARNCDRLSAEQCKKIFEMEMGIYLPQEATDRDRDIARCTAYGVIDALFAQAAERKGESDGR